MIFTEDMFENLKDQFELYAHRDANCPGFLASVDDIRHFTGILLISGYHCLPCERDYWSTADDLGCNLVMKAMSRARFQELKRFSRIADNQALGPTKVAKIQLVEWLFSHNNQHPSELAEAALAAKGMLPVFSNSLTQQMDHIQRVMVRFSSLLLLAHNQAQQHMGSRACSLDYASLRCKKLPLPATNR